MNQSQAPPRRIPTATGLTASTSTIPRAPPLPAPKALQRARDAASRLLGYPSRPTSPLGSVEHEERYVQTSGRVTRYPVLSANHNASATHKTGLEINTVAINGRGTHAVIGGKDIFRTIKIEQGRCAEDINLRTTIRGNPKTAAGQPRTGNPNIDISDVAWASADYGDYIAAATTSGKIVLYNLARADLQATQLHEHARQVHRVTFNPHKSNYLLSGSQDGTVRLWDLRDARNSAAAIRSKRNYTGHKSPVRDVKWSPTEGLDFACGTDDGYIQRWDLRDWRAPTAKISAHTLSCNTVDWHPDGKHILGASLDGTVRVFDMSQSRPKKALWEIRTPYPVFNARWRPATESILPQDKGAKLCTQLVTSYDREHPIVHVWDLRRPYLPFRQCEPYPSAPTDLIWHSQDLLWTVGREGVFVQNDVQHMSKVVDHRSLQAFDISPLDDVAILSQRREQYRPPRPKPSRSSSHTPVRDNTPDGSPENTSISRSWGDDSLDQTFLAILPFMKQHPRSSSINKSYASVSTTISQSTGTTILKLNDILMHRKSTRPPQTSFHGRSRRMNVHNIVQRLAHESLNSTSEALSNQNAIDGVCAAIERHATLARNIGLYRLARTWAIFGYWIAKHLRDHEALRSAQPTIRFSHAQNKINPLHLQHTALALIRQRLASHHTGSPSQSPMSMRPQSRLARHLGVLESTSNVPTPLARPSISSYTVSAANQDALLDIDREEPMALPPSLVPAQNTSSSPLHPIISASPDKLTLENLTDLRRLSEIEDRASPVGASIERWRSHPTRTLNVDLVDPNGLRNRPKLEKHDSDESFGFMIGSTDSGSASLPASFESEDSTHIKKDMVSERPSRVRSNMTADADPVTAQQPPIHDAPPPQIMLFHGSGTLGDGSTSVLTESREAISDEQTVADSNFDVAGGSAERHDIHVLQIEHGDSEHQLVHGIAPHTTLTGHKVAIQKLHSPNPITSAHAMEPGDAIQQDRIAPSETNPATVRQAFSTKARSHLDTNQSMISSPIAKVVDEVDRDIEEGNAVVLIDLLKEQLRYYTADQPSAQIASALLLIIGPLLPRTHPIASHDIRSTLDRFYDHLAIHLDIDAEDAASLLTSCYDHPVKAGLQPLQIESILSSYHEQLCSYRMFNEAASLRRLCHPAYPAVYSDHLDGSEVRFKCATCGGSVSYRSHSKEVPETGQICPRCESCSISARLFECVVCGMARSPFYRASTKSKAPNRQLNMSRSGEYSVCLTCRHVGHAACYQMWFADEGGTGCPTSGCLCLCGVTGKR